MKVLLRAALKSSAGTLVALLSSVVAIKIIATVAGPTGIGLFSILRQAQQTAAIAGSIGGQAAIVQGLSNKTGDERDAHTALILRAVLTSTFLFCVAIILGAPWAAPLIIGAIPNSVNVLRLIAVPTLLGTALIFLSGIITSHRRVGLLAIVQIASGLSLASFAYFAATRPTAVSFILLLSASGLVGLTVAAYFCVRNDWLRILRKTWWRRGNEPYTNTFYKVGAATMAAGMMGAGAVLIVRMLVRRHHGLEGAGIFDAAWTISMTYVTLILTSLSAYYLPTLTTLHGKTEERNQLIQQYFKFSTFASIPLIGSVVVLKPLAIHWLYSEEFFQAIYTMRWMLLGDFFKISSWVFSMPMLAYADMRPYLIGEFFWNAAFVSITAVVLYSGQGIESIGIVFLILYVLYFLYTYSYCVKKYQFRLTNAAAISWILGLIFLLLLSAVISQFQVF